MSASEASVPQLLQREKEFLTNELEAIKSAAPANERAQEITQNLKKAVDPFEMPEENEWIVKEHVGCC